MTAYVHNKKVYFLLIEKLLKKHGKLTDTEICSKLYSEMKIPLTLDGLYARKLLKHFKKEIELTGKTLTGLKFTKSGLKKFPYQETREYYSLKN